MMNVILKNPIRLVLSKKLIVFKAGDSVLVDVLKGIAYHISTKMYFDIDRSDYLVPN